MPSRNVIMWCDHRAQAQADRLNRSDSPAIARVVRGAGGHLSPELDVPKLVWLNEVPLPLVSYSPVSLRLQTYML